MILFTFQISRIYERTNSYVFLRVEFNTNNASPPVLLFCRKKILVRVSIEISGMRLKKLIYLDEIKT